MSYHTGRTWLRASRFATVALMFAIGGSFAPTDANAAPLTFAKGVIAQVQDSNLTLVRDGCGRGMRFSNRRQACVPQGGGGVDPGAAIVHGIIQGVVGSGGRGDGCPRGMRFSNSRQACVRR